MTKTAREPRRQVYWQQSLAPEQNDARRAVAFLEDAVEALRKGDTILLQEARGLGWIGAGVLSYRALDDNIMMGGAR